MSSGQHEATEGTSKRTAKLATLVNNLAGVEKHIW